MKNERVPVNEVEKMKPAPVNNSPGTVIVIKNN